ncbi:MAG: pilus assembly protein [Acidobacteria bacterium]|nr:pilus assembly protein [Acidobacteriota bacterium]
MTTARRLLRERDGTAAVELALILPVLVVLLLGPIEIGRLEYHYQVGSEGVRDAGRYLAVVPIDCSGGVGAGTFVNATDLTNARNLAMTGSISDPAGSGDYLVPAWNDAATTFSAAANCKDNTILGLDGMYAGCNVIPSVTVTASMRFTFLGSLPFLPVNIDLPFAHTQANTSSATLTLGC